MNKHGGLVNYGLSEPINGHRHSRMFLESGHDFSVVRDRVIALSWHWPSTQRSPEPAGIDWMKRKKENKEKR